MAAQMAQVKRARDQKAIEQRGRVPPHRKSGSDCVATDPDAYADSAFLAYAVSALEASEIDRVVSVGVCSGAGLSLMLAAEHPDRVSGVVAINPGIVLTPQHPHRRPGGFDNVLERDDGWAKENRHFWMRDWPGYADFFFGQLLPEPHSTKQHEDAVEWACGTTAEMMVAEVDKVLTADRASPRLDPEAAAAVCRRVLRPVLVINGDRDQCQPPAPSRRVAQLIGGELVVLEGAGHLPQARDPVKINLEINRFVRRVAMVGSR